MASLNYPTYVAQIANLLVIDPGSSNFTTMLPGMIDYAEQRAYRDLDLLHNQITDATTTVSSGNRNFTLPITATSEFSGVYVTVDQINIITPSTATSLNGTRNVLIPTSREVIDTIYPSGQAATNVPQFYAMISNTEVMFGPAPDAAYVAEVVGIQRPNPLSSANSSTILTQYVPDLFIAASMVFGSGYQQNFSAQGDNPQQGISWEAQYQRLMQTADTEQMRAKFQGDGWTTQTPSPLAKPPRA